MSNTFGNSLKQIRRSKKISQRELAARIGVDFSYISKIENDRLPPPAADTVVKIAQALDLPTEELLSRSGKLPSSIRDMLGTNPAAIRFMQIAKDMDLSGEEWGLLTDQLKKLR